MNDVNKIILVGRLGADAILRATQGGSEVLNFSIATGKSWEKNGEKVQQTQWHKCVLWGKRAPKLAPYLTKGKHIYVEGELEQRSWKDKNGDEKHGWEVVVQDIQLFGGGKSQEEPGSDYGY
jgi:single-strand DNA-binding protein